MDTTGFVINGTQNQFLGESKLRQMIPDIMSNKVLFLAADSENMWDRESVTCGDIGK